MASATRQSIVGASAVPPPMPPLVGQVPVKVAMMPDQWTRAGLPPRTQLKLEKTVTFFLYGSIGRNSSLRSKSAPILSGNQRAAFTPHPQNHVPKRTGIGAPEANARPLLSRKQSRTGRATVTAEVPNIPFRTLRLFHLNMGFSGTKFE